MTIGLQIAKYRKDTHMTQEQLGEAVGVTNRTVSKWESGVSSPGVDLIPSIASALGISLDQLFGIGTQRKTEELSDMLSDMLKDAVTAAIEDVLPGAVEEALDALLPECIAGAQSQDGYSLSVMSKDKTRVCQFRGRGVVAGPINLNGSESRWVISVPEPGGIVYLGEYDSKEEATADLNRVFNAYTSEWSRIEL